ncbi:MAG: hypothetical protein ACKO2Z_03150 [Sphaerospermopsis kisseleviana]
MLQSLTKKLPILVSFCLVNSYNFLPAIAVDVCTENLTKGEYKYYNRRQEEKPYYIYVSRIYNVLIILATAIIKLAIAIMTQIENEMFFR